MVGIRCDANSIIASGHMMRCLTVAKELVRLGESVTFFVADEESKTAFENMATDVPVLSDDSVADSDVCGLYVVVLGSDWKDLEPEIPSLEKELSANATDILLVDSYSATAAYFEKLKELCPVACFDDLHEDIYPVDILINYSGFCKQLGYEESYKDISGHNGGTKLLLGLNYAPLRDQFHNRPEADRSEEGKADILLASGGADSFGMLLATLNAAEKEDLLGGVNWHVVVGSLVEDAGRIEELSKKHPDIRIHRAVKDMAGLMRQCNIAICAAGTMLTECAAVELPTIFYQVADNQKYNVGFWSSIGGMSFAGDVRQSGDEVVKNICGKVKALLTEEGEVQRMKRDLSGLTDGRGAIRIAKALLAEKGN